MRLVTAEKKGMVDEANKIIATIRQMEASSTTAAHAGTMLPTRTT